MDTEKSKLNDYHELLLRLEKANETLAYYKSNKDISLRDLQKLELENSALAEENSYLKSRIRNIERNVSNTARSQDREEVSEDLTPNSFQEMKQVIKLKIPRLDLKKESDSITVTASEFHPQRSNSKFSTPCSTKRSLNLKENAILRLALAYNL